MNNKVKDIGLKNCLYYFFDDIVNIKIFDSNNIKIDENSNKNILQILIYTLFSTKWIDTLKKLMEINI